MPNPNNCLRYWDLADHIRIDDAIALWCGVEPAELASLNFETQCMSAKRAALVTALRTGRLEYEDLGIVTARGQVFKGAPIDELLEKDRLVIDKASLRRWFEQLPFEDRPAFLFDEARRSAKYRAGERPNADAIPRLDAPSAIARLMCWRGLKQTAAALGARLNSRIGGDDECAHPFSGRSRRERPSPPSRPSHGRDGDCKDEGTDT